MMLPPEWFKDWPEGADERQFLDAISNALNVRPIPVPTLPDMGIVLTLFLVGCVCLFFLMTPHSRD